MSAPEMRDYVVLDVFTSTPLEGNQLAVFLDGSGLEDAVMRRAARELHLSETVFLFDGDADCDARMRIFTPGAELPFAGHPVLGTAFLVAERSGRDEVSLRTGAGIMSVRFRRAGGGLDYGEMAQPIPTISDFDRTNELLAALGVARTGSPIECYVNGPTHVLAPLASEQQVAELEPDLAALKALGTAAFSCFAGSGTRYKARMFGPAIGIPEDPACGSAAGPIALHLARHGRIAYGEQIEIRQGAEIGRPSLLYARVEGGPDSIDRVVVGGSAVLVARGSYRLG
jgi:trans-2,3-dihydro-3-hydroxyanthranilate isomerase